MMDIYPTETVTLETVPEMNAIQSGGLLVVPFTLAATTGLVVACSQLSETQDYSIRQWVSVYPNGGFLPTYTSFFHLNRSVDYNLIIYDRNSTPPTAPNLFPISLSPGDYHLNFLNLINAENIFSFSASVLQL